LFKELGEKDQCGRTYENFFFWMTSDGPWEKFAIQCGEQHQAVRGEYCSKSRRLHFQE
jgi:hypothetical protein